MYWICDRENTVAGEMELGEETLEIGKDCLELIQEIMPYANSERIKTACLNRKMACEIIEETAANGERLQLLNIEGRTWLLNSAYNPAEAVSVWVEQFVNDSRVNQHSIFLVLGLGDGRAISKLLDRVPLNTIYVYEPCMEVFLHGLTSGIVQELKKSQRVMFFVEGISEEMYTLMLQKQVDYTNYRKVICTALPNYDRIFVNEYKKMLAIYKGIAEYVNSVKNTELERAIESARNMYGLARDIICQYSVEQLIGSVKDYGMEDIPAILVAAGPSLDKNITFLKDAKGKAFIMVVDTALNTVLEHGILPDMTITIDSRKPLRLFEHPEYARIPIVLAEQSREEAVQLNQARHYYALSEESYLGRMIASKTKKKVASLESGGSVANSALDFLVEMGFKTIILIGQDLAYPNGIAHTQNAYKGNEAALDLSDSKYLQIEGNDGKLIWTEWNMNAYRKWMEQYICRFPSVRFVNATEGGARIHGTEIWTLKDAIQTFCKKEFDSARFFGEQETFLTSEEQSMMFGELENIPKELERLEADLSKLSAAYKKLENAKPSQINNIAWLKKMLVEIGDLTSAIEDRNVSILIRPYMIEISYAVEEEVYDYGMDDSLISQIQGIVKQGKTLLKGYDQGILELKKEIHVLVNGSEYESFTNR